MRFGFTDKYENSIWDAKPYSITGAPAPKISHYDEVIGANVGGPLKIPHIYNGADKTFFFVNYQHTLEKSPVDVFAGPASFFTIQPQVQPGRARS